MLKKLHIQNYAIIDELEIAFSENMNIITGETGAGKSILMGALNLILGERADSSVLKTDNRKCIVEGVFNVGKESISLKDFFDRNDLDNDEEIVLRREVSANGKSRSFINDTPVNLNQLKQLTVLLVDLHQQFDTADLSSEDFQRAVIDALADNQSHIQEYTNIYQRLISSKGKLKSLSELQSNANKESDYNQFLYDELEVLSFKENELEELDAELSLLSNSENIKQQLSSIYFELKDSEQPVAQQLKVLVQQLQGIQQYHPELPALQERLSSAVIEVRDIADEISRIESGVAYNAERIEVINERISAGYKLQKKHGVKSTNELLEIQAVLKAKLEEIVNASAAIEALTMEVKMLEQQAQEIAATISARRTKQVKPFVENVNKLLVQVGMPNARLKVSIQPTSLHSYGADSISFLFDANKSDRFEPLRKVASGGELSRLMLSIKSLVAKKLQLPTLIFDEIDTGISGEAAKQVGLIMKSLSANHQLIAITHQPQIASKADAHYFVYKEIKNDKIVTSIRLLTADERITSIARMLSGENPTAAALENAKEMVGN